MIRNRFLFFLGFPLLALLLSGAIGLHADEMPEGGVPLTGEYQGTPSPDLSDLTPTAESLDGAVELSPPAKVERPVVAESLAAKLAVLPPGELIRVIVFLEYQPHDVISDAVRVRHGATLATLEAERAALLDRYGDLRDVNRDHDAENYRDSNLDLTPEDSAVLRSIGRRHEALSLVMQRELAAQLKAEMARNQAGVRAYLENLGGTVEYGAVAINAIVARVPVWSLTLIAANDEVARIVEDRALEGHLTNADDATRVSSSGGLWVNGEAGGAYDPAIVDSGTDMTHPGMQDAIGRDNFSSWYHVAAVGDPNYFDWPDFYDHHGHGTHVAGIVASYGTSGYPDHLGMAHGVEKLISLKAGWRARDYMAYMYWSDAMGVIDRALNEAQDLIPSNTFNDEVDGFNLSYGSLTTSDETDFSRFWDSVISSYSDTLVTISAGNSGPDNADFNDPACNYNALTVANVNDKGTADRDDDAIAPSSTRGPTANGRRKPDIAAPGSGINSANNNWETELDYVDMSGTSMAAPMVLGVAMDLMDAGVIDELRLKALLLNTAQKNEGLIDFENDADGWDEAYGWGYMNAWAAYYHRSDVIAGSVTARPNAGYYHLYKGTIRDEGASGEGRDRATLVWNRHVTYKPNDYPTTYYSLSDLNLRLYREDDGFLMDTDFALDNVHQVRIDSGLGSTEMVVKVYSWSTSFAHGGISESFALATEENFVEVDLPGTFQGYGIWPAEMEPNEERDFTFWIVNNSDAASHLNEYDLSLPTGWSRVSGSDPYSAGSIAGVGGSSSSVTWRLKAQSTTGSASVIAAHTHDSYAEVWGPFNWSMPVDVAFDATPPTPNPMTFSSSPDAADYDEIDMTATTASDPHGPVEYYFDFVSSPTGGAGGSDSGWQSSRTYTDAGLGANHEYGYRVKARDGAISSNRTSYSGTLYTCTHARVPGVPAVNNPTSNSLDVTVTSGGNPSWTEYAIWLNEPVGGTSYYTNASGGSSGNLPVWQTASAWSGLMVTGLTPDREYRFTVKARNGDDVETAFSSPGSGRTDPLPGPVPDIKINGSDGPLVLPSGSTVNIGISLDPGNQAGVTHDWWAFATRNSSQTWWRGPGGWGTNQVLLYNGALIPVNNYNLGTATIPGGSWVFNFAVDALNGTYEGTYIDTVVVTML